MFMFQKQSYSTPHVLVEVSGRTCLGYALAEVKKLFISVLSKDCLNKLLSIVVHVVATVWASLLLEDWNMKDCFGAGHVGMGAGTHLRQGSLNVCRWHALQVFYSSVRHIDSAPDKLFLC